MHMQEDDTNKPGYLILWQPKRWVTDEVPNLKSRHVTTHYMIRAIQLHIYTKQRGMMITYRTSLNKRRGKG